jgi:TrmH family RNA methyltransferase
MIPLHKLAALPRRHRLRKTAKIIGMMERSFAVSGQLDSRETEYIHALLKYLADDKNISQAALNIIKTALSVFATGELNDIGTNVIRRTFNNIHYVLLSETGVYQADWDFIKETGILDSSKRHPFPGMQVYLEDVRSPFNVGSMFRTAESFGVEKIWLSPLCADPRHKRSERTAMGCVDIVPWEKLTHDPFTEQDEPKPFFAGPVFTLETGGIALEDFNFPKQGIIIAGSEELGVSPQALAAADASAGRVSINIFGAKASLNVSVAFGIVMQAWAAANQQSGLRNEI